MNDTMVRVTRYDVEVWTSYDDTRRRTLTVEVREGRSFLMAVHEAAEMRGWQISRKQLRWRVLGERDTFVVDRRSFD